MNPRKRFGMSARSIEEELASDEPRFAVWDLDAEYKVEPEKFMTKGRSTPFDGWIVKGKCMMTVVDGKVVYRNQE